MLKRSHIRPVLIFAAICLMVLCLTGSALASDKGAYAKKEASALAPDDTHDQRLIDSWASSLCGIDADIAFFGDSLTHYGSWSDWLPDLTVCNLGVSGDTVGLAANRVKIVTSLNAKKTFLMIGINDIVNSMKSPVTDNDALYDSILSGTIDLITQITSTGTRLYIESILPSTSGSCIDNSFIQRVNSGLRRCADKYGLTYIDLSSVMCDENGALDPAYAADTVHLSDEGYSVMLGALKPYIYDNTLCAPTLTFKKQSACTVKLSWTNTGDRYTLKRFDSDDKWTTLLDHSYVTSYFDTGLTPGKSYFYTVSAAGASGHSTGFYKLGNGKYVTVTARPQAPQNISVDVSGRRALLSWDAVSDADGYLIKRRSTANAAYTSIGETGSAKFTDTYLLSSGCMYRIYSYTKQNGKTIYSLSGKLKIISF